MPLSFTPQAKFKSLKHVHGCERESRRSGIKGRKVKLQQSIYFYWRNIRNNVRGSAKSSLIYEKNTQSLNTLLAAPPRLQRDQAAKAFTSKVCFEILQFITNPF